MIFSHLFVVKQTQAFCPHVVQLAIFMHFSPPVRET